MVAGCAAAKKVMVRLPNWLGDALMARPLLHALRAQIPDAHIAATGPAPLLALLARESLWNDCAPWPAPAGFGRGSDLALILPPSFSSAWHAWRSGARRRIGFAGDTRSWLLSDAWRRPERGDRHLSDEYRALGALFGLVPADPPLLSPTAAERETARELLERTGGVPDRWVVLGPGAAYGPAKRWPAARFATLAGRLAARGITALVCGGADDRDTAREVSGRAGAHGASRSLAGETTLGAQLALCAGAVATISNDSGLAHLAAATGAPTVVVFGSTSSAWTAPLGPRTRVVQHAPVCAPCFRRTCAIGYRCLDAVTVEEVARCVPA
jgi:heptosyltransferase II